MSDLIDRLREIYQYDCYGEPTDNKHPTCQEAADRIEELEAVNYELQFGMGLRDKRIAKLEKVLELIATANSGARLTSLDCERVARQALGQDTDRLYPVDY